MQMRFFVVVLLLLSGCASQEKPACAPERVGAVDIPAVIFTSDYGSARMKEYGAEHGLEQLKAESQRLVLQAKKMQQELSQNPSMAASMQSAFEELKREMEVHRQKVESVQQGARAYAKSFATDLKSVIELSVREVANEQGLNSVITEKQIASSCSVKVELTAAVKARFDQKMKTN